MNIHDQYNFVAPFSLNGAVPDDIAIQFDTARNLYLYAWYVYRFYPVAEHQAIACLELALRERYEKEIPKKYLGRLKRTTLKPLLRYAVDKGDIKNEGFRRWHEAAERRARYRYQTEKLDEMREKGLEQIELDDSEIIVMDVDRSWEYIKIITDTLPKLRNHYAHGTKMLHNQVLGTIQIVSEIINQVYPNI